MKRLVKRIGKFIASRIVGKHNMESLISSLAHLAGIDLLNTAHQSMGITKYKTKVVSGEQFLIEDVLRGYLNTDVPTLFDVGAHVGEYSKALRSSFPKAEIYAFEPNPHTFDILVKSSEPLRVYCHNLGLGSTTGQHILYDYADKPSSQHASIYQDVLTELHGSTEVEQVIFQMDTIDQFCGAHNIDRIDFIKIDVEGHEFEVLRGAKRMIQENRIGIIQFEFNEMNVISRVFLRDFYELLNDFELFRLDSHKLIHLKYHPRNEIFRFQNFVAIDSALWKKQSHRN